MCLNCFPYARPNDQYDKPRQCIEKQKHHFANKGRIVKAMIFPVKVKSVSRVRLCDPMDCSLSGSSVHGIFQARVLEWIAISLHFIYPYICWQVLSLRPCSGYCKQCCCEHWGVYILSNSGFLCLYAWVRLKDHMVAYFNFFKGNSILFSILAVLPTVSKVFFFFLCTLSSTCCL